MRLVRARDRLLTVPRYYEGTPCTWAEIGVLGARDEVIALFVATISTIDTAITWLVPKEAARIAPTLASTFCGIPGTTSCR